MVKEKFNLLKNSFAKNVIELKLASDRLVVGKGEGAGVFTIKYQVLYLIASNERVSPQGLIKDLNMAKSNLALLAKKMIKEGLIISEKSEGNKKQIYYSLTDKGFNELLVKMNAIEKLNSNNKEMLKHLSETIENLKKVK